MTLGSSSTVAPRCTECCAGIYSNNSATECTLCLAGSYSSAAASECTNCSAGHYSDDQASAASNLIVVPIQMLGILCVQTAVLVNIHWQALHSVNHTLLAHILLAMHVNETGQVQCLPCPDNIVLEEGQRERDLCPEG